MTLRHMKIFVTVCQENNITAAAKKLFISQPAVSIAIKEIEEYYGIKLFDRLSRKIYITQMGEIVFNYALHITSLFDEMDNTIKDKDTVKKIKIGSSISIGTDLMPSYVKKFSDSFPDIQVFVTVDSSDIIEQMILDNKLDFALIEGVIHSDNIVTQNFLDDELVVVCNRSNPLTKKNQITMGDLKSQKFLLREINSGTREVIESIFLLHNVSITPIWESSSTQAIINAVISGIGVSILPYRLVKLYIETNRITRLNIDNINFKRQLHIIYHKNKYLSTAANKFLELCNDSCNKN